MNDQLKKVLQREMEREADIIMEEVNKDPLTRDAKAPENMKAELFQKIRHYEEQRAAESLSAEDKEYLRLGKIYKKKKKRKKYYLLAAILVVALFGGVITTMGGPSRVFKEVKRLVGGREQTNIDTDDVRVDGSQDVNEEDAYQKCEDVFGVYPVRAIEMPDGIHFAEIYIDKNMQMAYLVYESEDNPDKTITYSVYPNYRTSSVANDVEDKLTQEFTMKCSGNEIQIQEYEIEGYDFHRWSISFEYKDTQYIMIATCFEQTEIEKIVEKFKFN